MDDSIDSGNVTVRSYLPLSRKDPITHLHGLVVYVNEVLPFARVSHSVSYFFFLYQSHFSSLSKVFDSVLSNIDEVLSINPFLCLSLETLKFIIRTGVPILVELIDLVNFVIIFFISYDLIQMVNFPTRIPDCDSHSPTLWNFFPSYRNFDYKNFDQDIFSQELCTSLFSEIVLDYTSFEENFLGVLNKYAPLKKKVLRTNHAPCY